MADSPEGESLIQDSFIPGMTSVTLFRYSLFCVDFSLSMTISETNTYDYNKCEKDSFPLASLLKGHPLM